MTVSLMVLLALLAVGLLSLSGITLREAGQAHHRAEARANARLALTLAIAQLQQSAGPDQRITTTADQLSGSGSDGSESAAAADRRHWTGVYRSWSIDREDRPEPEFISWLVSGAEDGVTSEATARSSAIDPVPLVDQGTLGGQFPEGRVAVPAIGLAADRGSGRLAWWTGDQGVKATIDAPPASGGDMPAEIRMRLQNARRSAIELAATGGGQRPFDAPEAESPGRVTSWPQAAFVARDRGSYRGLFHDLAPHSSGMITNVRAGGFRRDLSLYLEREADEAPREPLYTLGSGSRAEGINLAELWLYYNIYKDLQTRRRLVFTTGGSSSRDTPFLEIAGSEQGVLQDPSTFYKQPTVISYKTVLSFHARQVNTPDGPKERLAVVVDPIITYWNPLDVPVSIQPAYNSIKFWQIPYDVTLTVGGRTVTTSLRQALAQTQWHYLTLIAGKVQPIILKPGEVLVYSQAANTDIRNHNPGLNFVDGKAGWNLGGGVAIDLRDPSGGFIEGSGRESLRYRIRPNNEDSRGTRHWFLTGYSLYYKEDRANRGESVSLGASIIDYIYGNPHSSSSPKPGGLRLKATQAPHVFDTFDSLATRPLTFAQLRGRKEPFLLYAHNAKTEYGTDRGGRWLARYNPKAMLVDFATLSEAELDILPFEIQVEPLNSWKNRNLEVSPDGNGFFGGGMNAEFGTNHIVTHAIPREPVTSLAAFQHAFANGFSANAPEAGYAIINARQPMLPQICHPIGNSLAPSVLPPDETSGSLDGGRLIADHSYLANRALWDDWFLSGIAPQLTAGSPNRRAQRQVALDFLKGETPLPSARYRLAADPAEADSLLGLLFDGRDPAADGHLLTAALLRVEGMFNINSTSVEAWKAVLGSLREQPVVTADASGNESVTPSETATAPVAQMIAARDLVASGDGNVDIQDPAQWVGRRTLDDDEIEALAHALVREIRKRGPFLSLADFINRRPGSDRDLAAAGAIQSALDAPETGLNTAYLQGNRAVPADAAARFPFSEAEAGAAAYGAPGIIRQADILTPIAPILSARSDSFIIRAYGESIAGGKVAARAWCEAVIERQPQFLDSADGPNAVAGELDSPINRRFGRRFELISFRWLNPQEI